MNFHVGSFELCEEIHSLEREISRPAFTNISIRFDQAGCAQPSSPASQTTTHIRRLCALIALATR